MKLFDYSRFVKQVCDNEIMTCIAEINKFKEKQELYSKTQPTDLDKFLSTKPSNKISGITITNPKLWKLIKGEIVLNNKNEKEILNYYNILDFIHKNHEILQINSVYIFHMYCVLFNVDVLPNIQKTDMLNAMRENY